MPNIPISSLPTTTTVSPSAILILDQNGTTYQGSVTQILGSSTLASDSDVHISNPLSGQVLTYSTALSGWTNATFTSPVSALSQLNDVKDTGTYSPANGQVLTWNTALSAWMPSTVSSSGGSGLTTASIPSIIQNSAWSANRPSTVSLISTPTPGNLVVAMTSLHPGSYGGTSGFTTLINPSYNDESFMIQVLPVLSGDTGTYTCGGWSDDGAIMLFEVIPGGVVVTSSNPIGTGTVTNLPGPIAYPLVTRGVALVGYSSEYLTSTGAATGWTDYGNSGTHHGGAVHGRVFNQSGLIQDTFSGSVTSENMAVAMIVITPQIMST